MSILTFPLNNIFLNVLTHLTGEIMCDIRRRPCVLVHERAVQHLHSTATQHSTFIAQPRPTHRAQSPHTLTYCLNSGPHSHCSGGRWWKGGHRGQSRGKMGLWRGRRSSDKTNSRDSKIGSPFKYVHGGLSALSYYYYASSTKNCEPILNSVKMWPDKPCFLI